MTFGGQESLTTLKNARQHSGKLLLFSNSFKLSFSSEENVSELLTLPGRVPSLRRLHGLTGYSRAHHTSAAQSPHAAVSGGAFSCRRLGGFCTRTPGGLCMSDTGREECGDGVAAKPLGQRGEMQKGLQRDGYRLFRAMTARRCTQGPDPPLVRVLPAQTSEQVTIIRQLYKSTPKPTSCHRSLFDFHLWH